MMVVVKLGAAKPNMNEGCIRELLFLVGPTAIRHYVSEGNFPCVSGAARVSNSSRLMAGKGCDSEDKSCLSICISFTGTSRVEPRGTQRDKWSHNVKTFRPPPPKKIPLSSSTSLPYRHNTEQRSEMKYVYVGRFFKFQSTALTQRMRENEIGLKEGTESETHWKKNRITDVFLFQNKEQAHS